jgi:two-component system, OmpR family, alkaline phosphatase synthesis response regulator PhoP
VKEPATQERVERPPIVLVIEDDRALREGLLLNFELHGYQVLGAADGEEGLRLAFDTRADLIVLDVMLPGFSGLEILAELRERQVGVPVLILSAQDTLRHKVTGLELGADDYVTKPFELPELLARTDAILRRRRMERQAEPKITFGQVVIDPAACEVRAHGRRVALSQKEYELLCLLARAPGRVYSRSEILDHVWGFGFEGTARTVDNFILTLRQKLEADPANPRHLITVRQMGYRLDP